MGEGTSLEVQYNEAEGTSHLASRVLGGTPFSWRPNANFSPKKVEKRFTKKSLNAFYKSIEMSYGFSLLLFYFSDIMFISVDHGNAWVSC